MHALTLALLSHERLVKGARDLMRDTSRLITQIRPARFDPQLFVTILRIKDTTDGRISVIEQSIFRRLEGSSEEVKECVEFVLSAHDPRSFASCFYTVGGSEDGKELWVSGINVQYETYTLARPIRFKKGVGLLMGRKARPIEVEPSEFLLDLIKEYRTLIAGRYLPEIGKQP